MSPILIEDAKTDVLRRNQMCPKAQTLVVTSLMHVYLRDLVPPRFLLPRVHAPIPFSISLVPWGNNRVL